MRRLLIGTLLLTLASGCAGMSSAQVAQTAGAVGAVFAPGPAGPLLALGGQVLGVLIQGYEDQLIEKRERRELGEQLAHRTAQPVATAAAGPETPGRPARVWVDEYVRDGRLIAGHFEVRNIQ